MKYKYEVYEQFLLNLVSNLDSDTMLSLSIKNTLNYIEFLESLMDEDQYVKKSEYLLIDR